LYTQVHDLGLRDYLHVLQRRKWIVLLAILIVPLAAVALSLRQPPLYQSSADVLLRYQSLPSTVSGINDPNSYSYYVDPVRSTDTQLQVAELPLLANRVSAALRKQGVNPGEVAGSTSVSEVGDTDVLEFTANSGSPTLAAQIATEYARQFTLYHQELDTGSITTAIKGLRRRITQLQGQGGSQSRKLITELQGKIDQLQTLLTVQTSSAVVVRTAAGATKIRPKPTKYGLLGLGLGLVLGIGLALLRDAFDTRLRTPDQIGGVLGLPLLARVPPPTRQLQRDRQLAMIADPTSHGADAYRRLRMNLEFATVGKPSQVIMFASALAKEGKSTTLGNLSVAAALAGKSVALVDLDLRRPSISRFFRLDETEPGLTAVVLGHSELDDALLPVPLESLSRNTADHFPKPGANGDYLSRASTTGSLVVLPTGILPPDPGDFVGLEGVGRVVAALRERVDLVLLDVPPLLAVGDGLTISGLADALVVVIRSENARRKITAELGAVLARMRVEGLGFVLCGAGADDAPSYYGYGYGTGGFGAPTQRGRGAAV
jgi:Mrp family chromosome partitioning ATPase/capsular polysaccharide biosynthesis protein